VIAAHGLRWALTTTFAVVTVVSLARALRPSGPYPAMERTAHALHSVMGIAMAVMVWPTGMEVPAAPQALFFAVGAAWFAAIALLRGRGPRGGSPGATGHIGTHAVLHCVMMGGTAWMLLAISDGMGSTPSDPESMHGMPGMTMSGPGGAMSMHLHGRSYTVAAVLLAVFLAMGLWWLSRALVTAHLGPRPGEPSAAGPSARVQRSQQTAATLRAVDAGCHGAMALGMAVMLLAAL
jgi:hypothetical protein